MFSIVIVQSHLQDDVGYSYLFMNVLASVGMVGLNLNFIPGALKDRIGPLKTGMCVGMGAEDGEKWRGGTRDSTHCWCPLGYIAMLVSAVSYFLMSLCTTKRWVKA